MSIETVGVELPSDLELRKKINDALDELVSSKIRVASERDLVKDIVKVLSEDTGIPKKTINRWAKWQYLGNKDKEVGQITEEEEAFNVLKGVKVD